MSFVTTSAIHAGDDPDVLALHEILKTANVGEFVSVPVDLMQRINDKALEASRPAILEARRSERRLRWLHSEASNRDAEGYEWGIFRVKWENGKVADIWQTNADFSDLDAAMGGESTMTILVTQKSPHDCVLAAIAMAVGKTWEEAWTQEDLAAVIKSRGIADIDPWMKRHGAEPYVDYREVYVHGTRLGMVCALLWKRRALLSVNSLNNDGGSHMIYWDGECILDPNEGYEGKIAFKHLSSCIITRVYVFKENK